MESRGRVLNLLSDLFSLLEIEDLGTDFLDFWEILLVQLELSFLEGCFWLTLASSASVSFHTLEGVAPSLELLAVV